MYTQQSVQKSFLPPERVRPLKISSAENYHKLEKMGIGFNRQKNVLRNMVSAAMDSVQPSITQGSITTPVQFLQNWLPGFTFVITAARNIDKLVGIATIGSWEDEEIVQGVMELLGTAIPYGDYNNVPYSSWNANFVKRTVVRFELGMRVGSLESARAARIRVSADGMHRESCGLQLEIQRNAVGFYGYNSGNDLTYGFLNDPSLPAYVTVAVGSSTSTQWSKKSFLEITADIRTAVSALRLSSLDQIDPESLNLTLALPTATVDYLTVTSDFEISVRKWLTDTYPKIRVVSAPELDGANGGANVFYLYADKVNDSSTDDGRTFTQVVPAKFMVTGVEKLAKAYVEDYVNATAGVMCKRPWAVVRYSGI